MAFEGNLGTVRGLDYYDRKELCDLFNESDDRAFEYIAPYLDKEEQESLSRLTEIYDNSDHSSLNSNKEYQKLLWELLNKFGVYRNKMFEAFTRY